ncbi:MAG: hypothetical protein HC787_04415 [Nostocaceae cyanobacterium CSU_2_110]|nr:hypothetical protein [Nostocaceae cyanobacterium CSU_2_110]
MLSRNLVETRYYERLYILFRRCLLVFFFEVIWRSQFFYLLLQQFIG